MTSLDGPSPAAPTLSEASAMKRKNYLLAAAAKLLQKCSDSVVVLDSDAVTVTYDGADCDGSCLREEIFEVLGVETYEDPLLGAETQRDYFDAVAQVGNG